MNDPKNWMSRLPRERKMREILLPTTHDSGAAKFGPPLVPAPHLNFPRSITTAVTLIQSLADELSSLGIKPPAILEDSAKFIEQVILDFSQAQSMGIGGQLDGGIRALDLRIAQYEQDFYTFHGYLALPLGSVFNDILEFLESTSGEIVVAHLGGLIDGFDNEQRDGLLKLISRTFSAGRLVPSPTASVQFADLQLGEITGAGADEQSKLVVLYIDPNYNGSVPGIWNHDPYACDSGNLEYCTSPSGLVDVGWVHTPSDGDVIAEVAYRLTQVAAGVVKNKEILDAVDLAIDKLAEYEFKKHGGDGPLPKNSWHTLKEEAAQLNPKLGDYLESHADVMFNRINIDFFDDSQLVEEAIARSGGS